MKKVFAFIVISLFILVGCGSKEKNGKKETEKNDVKEYDFIKDNRLDVEYLCSKLFKNMEYKIGEIDNSYKVKYYLYIPTDEFETSSIKDQVFSEEDGRWTFFEGSEINESSVVNVFSEEKLRIVISKDDEVVSEYWDDSININFYGGTEVYNISNTPDNLLISDDGVVASHRVGFFEYGNYTELFMYSYQSKEMKEAEDKYRYVSSYVTVFIKDAIYVIYFCFDSEDESQIAVKGFECKMSSELDSEDRNIHSFTVEKYEKTFSLQ